MTRTTLIPRLTLVTALLLAPALAQAAPARGTARAPKPKLLLQVDKVDAKTPALQADGRRLAAALAKAIAAEPLTVATLGIKNPTKARVRWQLTRRRMKGYQLHVRLDTLAVRVLPGKPRHLEAKAVVAVTAVRLFARAQPKPRPVEATVKVPISVVLHSERLAVRHAAVRDVARAVVAHLRDKHVKGAKRRR